MSEAITNAGTCKRCGGPTKGQNVFQDSHRHYPDCIAYLKSVKPDPTPADAIRLALKVCGEYHRELESTQWPNEEIQQRAYAVRKIERRITRAAKQAGIEGIEDKG